MHQAHAWATVFVAAASIRTRNHQSFAHTQSTLGESACRIMNESIIL